MLKFEYRIMYLIADTKVLALTRLTRMQNEEIKQLKAENQRYKEGYKRAYLGAAIQSKTSKINLIA